MKQAVKKKVKLNPMDAIKAIKNEQGIGENVSLEMSNADKEMEWLLMPKGFVDATQLPGIPQGYCTTLVGHSNVGKSTLVNHSIVAAQKQGLLPILIDTEGNFSAKYAEDMGAVFEYETYEVVDEESGEVKEVVGNIGGQFVYYDVALLAKIFGKNDYSSGKETKESRRRACIEDVAACINYWLDKQDNGELPMGIVFIWDSVGSIPSYKSIKSNVGNNMFDAGSMSQAFNEILNGRLPSSRKVSSEFTNTLILVNKVWLDSMTNPVGPPSLELKGGKTVFYGSRLIILLGGKLKSSIKKLSATFRGETYQYGIESKISVLKNQLPMPFNITYEGKITCTSYGIVANSELESFKKDKIIDILKARDADLSEYKISELEFVEEDTEE